MTPEEKMAYLKTHIEPLYSSDNGNIFRAAVYLTDGTYLPCVRILNPQHIASQAAKGFDETKKGRRFFKQKSRLAYMQIVEPFVTAGNKVNEYDIDRIQMSVFALPGAILRQIKDERAMSRTGLCLRMKDGKVFGFGSCFLFNFFQMHPGYPPADIIGVINHSYISMERRVSRHKAPFSSWPEDDDYTSVHRERLFLIAI